MSVDVVEIEYLFRKPKIPIICSIDDLLITAQSEVIFQRRINDIRLRADTNYHVIDSVGEDWTFNSDKLYIVPSLRRKWSKKKIIRMYNESKNCQKIGITYSEKSLSSKRFEKVYSDIVELIEQSQ